MKLSSFDGRLRGASDFMKITFESSDSDNLLRANMRTLSVDVDGCRWDSTKHFVSSEISVALLVPALGEKVAAANNSVSGPVFTVAFGLFGKRCCISTLLVSVDWMAADVVSVVAALGERISRSAC